MFQPRESKSDLIIHRIGLFALVIIFAIIFVEISRKNALQYIYLEIYGSETTAVVLSALDGQYKYSETELERWETRYLFSYSSFNGETKQKSVILERDRVRGAYNKRFELGETVNIIVDDEASILLPKKLHQNNAADWYIFLVGLAVIIFSSVLVLWQLRLHKIFKESSRYY